MTPQRRVARQESFSMEFTTQSPDGEQRWFEAVGQPVQSEDGVQGGAVVIREITDRSVRRLQDQFMAIASHELRTPLTALNMYLELLLRVTQPLAGVEQAAQYARLALRQVSNLSRLVNDLLDVSRLRRGAIALTVEDLDLSAVVLEAVEAVRLLAEQPMVRTSMPRRPLMVHGDRARLGQVVLNLLTNAVTYAPESGSIDVRLRGDQGRAVLEVQDYGPGIPSTDLPHIFSAFSQSVALMSRQRGGLGLGLFIAHEIVNGHGGEISVQSTEGKGTMFTVRLPLLDS
jgi:two-component system CheB/CheR fusion protein